MPLILLAFYLNPLSVHILLLWPTWRVKQISQMRPEIQCIFVNNIAICWKTNTPASIEENTMRIFQHSVENMCQFSWQSFYDTYNRKCFILKTNANSFWFIWCVILNLSFFPLMFGLFILWVVYTQSRYVEDTLLFFGN